jgi:hypothetical protein
MIKRLIILAVLAIALVGMAGAANYMYEKASVKGVGYKNVEMIVSTQTGFNGDKLVEKESGSGNVITEKTELEAERQIGSHCGLCAACIGNEEFEKLYGKFSTISGQSAPLNLGGLQDSGRWTI